VSIRNHKKGMNNNKVKYDAASEGRPLDL
jgi:hypothetical protein